MKSIDLTDIKKTKITISFGVLAILVFGCYKAFFGILEWHTISFMSQAQGSDIALKLDGHLVDYKLGLVIRRIESTEDKLADLTLWESANSENDFTRDRKKELTRRLNALVAYRDCITGGGTNCDTLNPN